MPGPYSIRSRSIAVTHRSRPPTYELVISKRKLNMYHFIMFVELVLATIVTILLSWTPPDVCTAPPPAVCQWALVACVLLFATHGYMAGSHWHIPEETYSSRFILALWVCAVVGSIVTVGGLGQQAGDLAAISKDLGAEHVSPAAEYTIAPANWTEWYCDNVANEWVRDRHAPVNGKLKEITSANETDSTTSSGLYDPSIPPPHEVLAQLNDAWRIEVFHNRVLAAFGFSVGLLLLAVLSTCLYEGMMRMLLMAELSAQEAEADESGSSTHHKELREWELARKRSMEVEKVRGASKL